VLQLNKPLEFFEDIPDAHGIVRHWFVVKFPFTDAGGHRYVGGMAVDMTARKQAEVALTETRAELQAILQARTAELLASNELLQAKQAQLIQTAKLASLGELTAGVAHELNNPLNNISLCIANAVEAWTNPSEPREVLPHSLRLAQSEVQKAAHILTHLRTFGRAATGERSPQALHPIIRNALSLFEVPLRQVGVEVIVDVDLGHPVVLGDAIQLEQVFINLLQNAKDALVEAPQKRLYVTTRITEGSVYATVRDTGAGIPHAIKERIFDPFFTTKPIGHGTGLGLSISYGIIESHRGRLWVEDPPDGGAAFVMQLPLATPN
jgi:two-component system C4-dicarboxylate transport sensor histidine kinase DctB